ncbi:hypothetical protein COV13_02690 [Candidatus Woesearchaeota archaeon CG10_big_fil_rev_8_21_14_0_10_32_9]|nr:MAG: hypothetical protein COV13_02690 [Candidatus Woesearchaeota archaeon CG10_big_fil_rev_8_21_14_0_10_32_9]
MNRNLIISAAIFLILELILILLNQLTIALAVFKILGFIVLFLYFGIRIIVRYAAEIKTKLTKKNAHEELLIFYVVNIVFILILRVLSNLSIIYSDDWYFLLGFVGFIVILFSPQFEKKLSIVFIILISIASAIMILLGFSHFIQIEINVSVDQLKYIFIK